MHDHIKIIAMFIIIPLITITWVWGWGLFLQYRAGY